MTPGAGLADLLKVHDPQSAVLSLYLSVPLDPAELPGLPRIGEFLAEAADAGQLADADLAAVRKAIEAHGREWLGRTLAIFTCAGLGLHEVVPLARSVPGYKVPERAVVAWRPHILPLVAALQWYPAYRVVIVNQRHAWLFSVGDAGVGDTIQTMAAADAARVAGVGDWYALDTHWVQHRIVGLGCQSCQDTAAMLTRISRDQGSQPLVIGGLKDRAREFFADLPAVVRESFAGTFTVDPHDLTVARVRDLAAPVVTRWAEQAAGRLAAQIRLHPVEGLDAAGLPACLAAVNALAVNQLVTSVGGLIPGYACGTCGQLGTSPWCADCGMSAVPVPDLADEMACRVLEDGGQVIAVHGDMSSLAARLRFPVSAR
jgi:hypothetical protein